MAIQNGFEVHIDQTQTNAASIESVLSNMQQDMMRMKSSVDTLNSRWTGPSHDTFTAVFSRDFEAALEIWEDMMEITEEIRDACSDYSSCEREVYDVIQAIRIGG